MFAAHSAAARPSSTIPWSDDQSSHDSHIYFQDISDDNSSIHPSVHRQYHHNLDNENTHAHHQGQFQDAGCQVSSSQLNPVTLVKEAKKLSLPYFDPTKMTWTSFAMKLHASLIECDLAYLPQEPSTNHLNGVHSKELMLELFKKLQGSALSLFTSMSAQHYYLEGGRGIEMVKALVNKFHPLDNNAIQSIISSMLALELLDAKDLSVYKDKLENYNLQLSWVGQEMSPSFLVHLAQSQLGKSRYKHDIDALQVSYSLWHIIYVP
jgi:hypothetical protein